MSQSDQGGATATAAPPAPPPAPPIAPGQTPREPGEPRRGGGGLTGGVILVLIGVALLIAQFVPGVGILNLWPLIIVIAGLVEAFTPPSEGRWDVARFAGGLVTVAFGLVFLAITLGYVHWGVWLQILSLWPVLLISIGLGIIGRASHLSWVRALGSVAVILALAYAVASAYAGAPISRLPIYTGGAGFSESANVGAVRDAKLDLAVGLAETKIGAGGELISAKGESSFGTPVLDVLRSGSQADVRFRLGDGQSLNLFSGAVGATVDVNLSRNVVWDATIDAGVSSLDADLSDLKVRTLELKPGVSTCDVRLGRVPDGEREAVADIKAGVSAVSLSVPRDAQVRIVSDSGLVGHEIGASFVRQAPGRWETKGFSAAKKRGEGVWVINVKSGVGTFSIDTY